MVQRDTRVLVIGLLAAAAATASGQDSVSRNANGGSGLPGDALSPWSVLLQRTNYVVDLTTFRGSFGTTFGIAPVLKSGKANAARFNAYNGPCVISQTLVGGSFPAASYTFWNQPGGGLNTTENNTGLNSPVSPAGTPTLLGAAMLNFDEMLSGTTLTLANQIHGAQIAFLPETPSRLYVTRTVAAVNAQNGTQLDRSQFGLGSIDAQGNLVFRADGYGASASTSSVLRGENYFRVRLPARTTNLVNIIDDAGASNAVSTDWILQRASITHAVPSAIPADRAGGTRGLAFGADFTGLYRTETLAGTIFNTIDHRPNTLDDRGPATFSRVIAFPQAAGYLESVGSAAMLARSAVGGGKTDSISIWGLNSSGAVTAARTITVPSGVQDACDAFNWPLSGGSFRGYDNQMVFRGSPGPAAITTDAQGNVLAAGLLYSGTAPEPSSPFNAIAVARFAPGQNTAVTWTLAAWVDAGALTGKAVLADYGADGVPNTSDAGEGDGAVNALDGSAGRLASLVETSLGYAGPSMSSPAFDAAGNVYFVSAAALKRLQGVNIVTDYDLGLFRAVYNPGTMCYSVELLFRLGAVFPGANSGRNYKVVSLDLADSDSASSSGVWASSTNQATWNNIDGSSLLPADPRNLGGLVLSARVVYDTDNSGTFVDPTVAGNDVNSPDEAYNVMLYVGNVTPPPAGCDPDVNQDGNTDQGDVDYLINVVAGGPNPTGIDPDFNRDGNVDQGDIDAIINVIAGGPCS